MTIISGTTLNLKCIFKLGILRNAQELYAEKNTAILNMVDAAIQNLRETQENTFQ